MLNELLRATCVAILCSSPALANTWVVDDGGGPGVDFTDIQPAIDAALGGDTLIVMPGTYGGFVLAKPLRIVGQATSAIVVNGSGRVQSIANGELVALTDLTFLYSLTIENCAGVVVGDALGVDGIVYSPGSTTVTSCVDVRLRGLHGLSTSNPAGRMTIANSRVELCDSNVMGRAGFDLYSCPTLGQQAGNGTYGITVTGGELSTARTIVHGGRGGGAGCPDIGACDGDAGNGGDGLVLASNAHATLRGFVAHVVSGGDAGHSACFGGLDGEAGVGARLGSGTLLRYSGIDLENIANAGGTVETPSPAEPMLSLLEVPHPGSLLTFRVTGPAGATALLAIGPQHAHPLATPGAQPSMITKRAFDLGTIPPVGVVGQNVQLPATIVKGDVLFARARVAYADGTLVWTNSIPVIVR